MATTTNNGLGFAAWMAAVEAHLDKTCGLSSFDLPDCCYRDWFEDGVSPKRAAAKAMRAANDA